METKCWQSVSQSSAEFKSYYVVWKQLYFEGIAFR